MIAILIECDNNRSLGGSCERDLYNIHLMLVQNLKIHPKDIYIHTNNIPYFTKKNIVTNVTNNMILSIENVLKIVGKNPLYIHISGHGYQGTDIKKIEIDGRCEQIVLSSGIFRDYQFNEMIKKYVHPQSLLRISVDTCHSGTFSNLCFNIDINSKKTLASKVKNSFFSNAYSISACKDNQLDSCDIGNFGGFGGGLTCHILDNNNLIEFITGDPIKVRNNLLPILKLLKQEPVLLVDN
jgi:hypothetical protein